MADTTAEASQPSEPLVPLFKKRSKARPTNSRTKDADAGAAGPSTLSAPSASEVVIPPPKKGQGFRSTLGSTQKRKLGDRRARDDDEDQDRRGNDLDVNWSTLGSKARLEAGMELEAEDALAAEEELRRKRRRDENDGFDPDDDDKPIDGMYKGQKGYQTLIKKRQEVPKAARVGPQRSTNTIRTVTLVDYQPDVCKDYKETGFCGFGDTCKFLHDRGTYLAGWQLDKLAENASKQVGDADSSDSEEEEDIPWACFICRKPYTDPIVTRCSHYFCSACAIKRFAKTPKCAACGQPTGGMFNRADKVIEKMREKQKLKEDEEAEEADPAVAMGGSREKASDDEEASDSDASGRREL